MDDASYLESRAEAIYSKNVLDDITLTRREPGSDDGEAGDLDGLPLEDYRGTDLANADLFLKLHRDDVRYCPQWDRWLIWTGAYWEIDAGMEAIRKAADLSRVLYQAAGGECDPTRRKTIAGLARSLEARRKQNDLLAMARCRVVVAPSDLDQGKFLLNLANGTLDLKTGLLRPHRQSDLLTHASSIAYDPDATAPRWERFLMEVFGRDADLIRFLWKVVGYSLTGDVREQIILICHGNGSNGKSKFLNVLRALVGKLALQAAPDLLMTDRGRSRHSTEQADLFGKRLVVCQETDQNRRFNEPLVKQLTGGDAIRARRMHEDFWEFEPTHKLWLSTNHKPEIIGTDYAIWRRIRLIPFLAKFHDPGQGSPVKDPELEAALMAELPGILKWAVAGCLAWQKEGLPAPEAVNAATEAYRADMDHLAGFLDECCLFNRAAEVNVTTLYRAYCTWCNQNGETAETQRKLRDRLTERGYRSAKNKKGAFWYGIALKNQDW